ncbi:hypothetical protein LTR84_004955 [Exophiala bonariae]|uniref:Acyltransferase 3 domain-containing protein n=1 Tax=Exophiala bonariae TaxID=1690606 RepID=A0AAV9NSE8_9EURO|nr:hypothetical protein LTR84_004955 [Exophiala bonariae]
MTLENNDEVQKPLISEEEKDIFLDTTDDYSIDALRRERRRRIFSKLASLARPAHAYRLGKRFAYCFVPQILRTRIWNDAASKPKFFPTSYLNGLRGITSVKVFTFHYTFAFSDFGFAPWGVNSGHRYILELPIIRYFYSGFTAHVFFGIAGYLTTLRLFQLIDKHDQASQSKVLQTVSGAVFRRGFRLYLPVFIITLITTTYIHFGFYEVNRPLLMDRGTLFPGVWNEPKPEMLPTIYEQFRFWLHEMFDLTNLLEHGSVYPWHDQHLWSILAEMQGSLHLYAILVATALCRRPVRLIVMIVMIYVYFLWNCWQIWVYILGAVVAQIDLLLTEREEDKKNSLALEKLPPSPPRSPTREEKPSGTFSRYRPSNPLTYSTGYSVLRVFGFLVAFYLLSYPIDGARDNAPGYMTLNSFIPEWMERKDKFYPNFGTALLILLLARSDPNNSIWRSILNSDLAQYLGKISFGLYLTHGPVLHAFGYMIPHKVWHAMGTEGIETTNLPWITAILIGWSISLVCCLCVADVWNREVESRCVKVVKKLEEFCFAPKK